MIVCHCERVDDRTVSHAIAAGASGVEEVAAACRAGGDCGGCHHTIERLLERAERTRDAAARSAVA